MLWRIISVLTSCTKKWLGVWKMTDSEIAHTSDAIRNTIKKEDEIHKQFLKFLTEPDYKTITLLSVFNPSEHIEISTFVRSLGMEFQRLTHYLQGTFAIKSKGRNHFWLIMSRNVTGSMRGSLNPNKNQHLFRFQEVSAEDSIFTIFSIRWPSWYVHMPYHRTCRGYNEASRQIGPQAQWKILRLKDGHFVMSPKQWPCSYAYISNSWFSKLKGSDGNPGERGYFIFESMGE